MERAGIESRQDLIATCTWLFGEPQHDDSVCVPAKLAENPRLSQLRAHVVMHGKGLKVKWNASKAPDVILTL